jgi:hypothetical protein
MKKLGIILYLILAYILFFSSCSPRIRFDPGLNVPHKNRVFMHGIKDLRPVNEKQGYKIFYIDSISDDDYKPGFRTEFKQAIYKKLHESFIFVSDEKKADVVLNIIVNHFYGEYSRSVKTVFWEYGTVLLLFIPRLATDAIPYNSFAGRVTIDLLFTTKNGRSISKSLDVKVTDKVSTYRRGNADTASRLSKAASPRLNTILKEVLNEIRDKR